MKALKALLVTILLLVAIITPGNYPAQAAASVTSYTIECNRVTATGTSTAPYASMLVYYLTMPIGQPPLWTTVPVVNGQYTISLSYAEQPLNTVFQVQVHGTLYPSTPDPTGVIPWDQTPGFWDGESFATFTGNCAPVTSTGATNGTSPVASGLTIPSGAVLKVITCDTAVFDAPGGNPVGSNAIKAGQTWYVIPTIEQDSEGREWTPIFVSGSANPYILTACIEGGVTPVE